MRQKYGFPLDKKIFVYGGNLGRPQDIPFVVKCLKACADVEAAYFVIAGSGTDRHYLENYVENERPEHVKLLGQIPKAEYDKMIACCDVGLIFLDHRFTIPNFPSRLLSYMQAGLPVLACTDSNTDIGQVIVDGGFGWWCESDDERKFVRCIRYITCHKITQELIQNEYDYLIERYSVDNSYFKIINNNRLNLEIYERSE